MSAIQRVAKFFGLETSKQKMARFQVEMEAKALTDVWNVRVFSGKTQLQGRVLGFTIEDETGYGCDDVYTTMRGKNIPLMLPGETKIDAKKGFWSPDDEIEFWDVANEVSFYEGLIGDKALDTFFRDGVHFKATKKNKK